MGLAEWIAIGAFVTAVVSAIAACFSVVHGRRAANEYEKQTSLKQDQQRDARQPYVWADIRVTEGGALHFVVGNTGSTVARNVRVTFAPHLPQVEHDGKRMPPVEPILNRGLSSITPGRTINLYLADGLDFQYAVNKDIAFRNQKGMALLTITVHADGPFGRVPPLTYEIDLDLIELSVHPLPGDLAGVTKAIHGLGERIVRSFHPPQPSGAPEFRTEKP